LASQPSVSIETETTQRICSPSLPYLPNLAILRRLTLNLLRKVLPRLPLSRKRKRAGWPDAIARSTIAQMREPCRPVGKRLRERPRMH
jgi:hypothetical protein